MKTKNYNIGKKLMTLAIVALISTASFGATKENPTLSKSAEAEKTTMVNVNPSAESKSDALTETLQNWMTNGSYWESENPLEVANSNISKELSRWMSNGSYWNDPVVKEDVKENISSSLKAYMRSGSYWKTVKNSEVK